MCSAPLTAPKQTGSCPNRSTIFPAMIRVLMVTTLHCLSSLLVNRGTQPQVVNNIYCKMTTFVCSARQMSSAWGMGVCELTAPWAIGWTVSGTGMDRTYLQACTILAKSPHHNLSTSLTSLVALLMTVWWVLWGRKTAHLGLPLDILWRPTMQNKLGSPSILTSYTMCICTRLARLGLDSEKMRLDTTTKTLASSNLSLTTFRRLQMTIQPAQIGKTNSSRFPRVITDWFGALPSLIWKRPSF